MKRELAALMFAAAILAGCDENQPAQPAAQSASTLAPATGPSSEDRVVATVRGHEVTLRELEGPLVDAYGLTLLLELAQMDLAQQDAQQLGIVVTDQDVADEVTKTLIDMKKTSNQSGPPATEPSSEEEDTKLSPAEHDQLLSLLLTTDHLTMAEFQILMRRNAIVRKLVAPKALAGLTDENVRDRFNAIYGEKAHVRFIRLPSMAAVTDVEKALQSGKTFEQEAGLHAYDISGTLNAGETTFTRKDISVQPAELRMMAFDLKPSEVSSPLRMGDGYCLLQLIEFLPPAHAKFEDYQESVKRDLNELLVQQGIKEYLNSIGVVAQKSLEIKDPVLAQQWEQKLRNYRNADELRAQLRKEQEAATSQPATTQEAAPTTVPGF